MDVNAETVTQIDIDAWYKLQAELAKIKDAEMVLRKKIFKGLFPTAHEGTNTLQLAEGWVMKATLPYTRKVDIALLTNLTPMLRTAGIPMDDLINYKPELVKAIYNTLGEDHRKLFDQILETKPGSPSLEIMLPKSAKPVA
jgi:hypothetical protein